MLKKNVFLVALGAALLCSGWAGATSVVAVNYDTAMSNAGLNPVDEDGNGDLDGNPNGILDSDELAVITSILADVTHPNHNAVHAAYTKNLAQMTADVGAIVPNYVAALAGYTVLGDAGTIARVTKLLTMVGKVFVPASYDLSLAPVLSLTGDPDGDGQTNLQEYNAIAGTGGPGSAKRTAYIAAIFTAPVTPIIVDFDTALGNVSLNPATTDTNGPGGTPNGILDSDELAVLSFILADTGNAHFAAAKAAYEKNLAQMAIDAGPYAGVVGVPLAGYMTLGDTDTVTVVGALLASYGRPLTLAGYDLGQSAVLAYNADPDSDGRTNVVEYQAISGTGGPTSQKRADYIVAIFTAYVNPECVACTSTGGLAEVGSNVCLRVPVSAGYGFQWSHNGTPLVDGRVIGSQCQSLQISNVQLVDSGLYACSYNDGTKAIQNYTVRLTVSTNVPAGGTLALLLLAALLTTAAGVLIVRAKRCA